MVKVPHARIGGILIEQNISSSSKSCGIFRLKKLSEPEMSDSVSPV